MFSKRTGWGLEPNRLTRLLESKLQAGERIVDLTESNPTRAEIDYPGEAILAGLNKPENLTYQPTPYGLQTAREAVVRYYAERGKTVYPEELILTASTSEAYAFLFKLLMDPGDQVLIPRPSYPLFDYLATLESLEPVSYPLVYEDSWSFDWRSLEQALGPRVRAVLAMHPGNPTGSYLKRDELTRLEEICQRYHLALIVDEVFLDYALDSDPGKAGSLAGQKSVLTFVLSGLSKVAGLPQMKLSWIWTGGPEPVRREALRRLDLVSDLFLSVGTPVQHALACLLQSARGIQPAISSRLASNYHFLRKETSGSAIDALKVEGGWYAPLRLPALNSSEEWAVELLEHANLHLHPGYLFDFPMEPCLVVSLLTESSTFHTGIRCLLDWVRQTTRD